MRNILNIILIMLLLQTAVLAGGGKADSCETIYPIVLAHGMGAQYKIAGGIMEYWNDIPDALMDEGATVYITSVDSMNCSISKGEEFRRQLLEILAISGAEKVNIIGHSHGAVYSRYAITNLPGLADKVASHTSISGPHRGSAMAELFLAIMEGNFIEDAFNAFFHLIMGDDVTDTVKNLQCLTRDYMRNVFNPNTPNIDGIYYQSYAYKINKIAGAGIFVPTWPILKMYEGDNDGMVSTKSAVWGDFKGVFKGARWSGVNHLSCIDMLWGVTFGFDAVGHFEEIVSDLKEAGF